jgi:acyl-CoA synthetase (NDP forming)
VGVDALFAQAGVIACHSAESMARTAKLLADQPLPAGRRVAIVSNAGGLGVLAADAAADAGLVVPPLPRRLRSRLARHVDGTAGVSNPIDLGAGASPEHLTGVVEPLLSSPDVDVLLVVIVPTSITRVDALCAALAEARSAHPDKPVVLVSMGDTGGPVPGVTVLRTTGEAIDALRGVVGYAEWRRTPPAEPEPHDPDRADAARHVARESLALGVTSGDGWMAAGDVPALLEPYGLRPVGSVATDPLSASALAEELGFPVVVKVADQSVVHKTDRGLVRVGLDSAAEVLATVRAFQHELGRPEVPVLVQPVVDGVEVALGVVRDPGFGPLVMVAAGGVATGIWEDRAFLVPPFSARDASRAIRSLRIWPLLTGYRGSPPADVAALERLLVSLGNLAADVPEVAELDLNPVMATPDGAVLVDVKVRLATAAPLDAGIPRRLRAQA